MSVKKKDKAIKKLEIEGKNASKSLQECFF